MSANISEMRRRTIEYHQRQAAQALVLEADEPEQPVEQPFDQTNQTVQLIKPIKKQPSDLEQLIIKAGEIAWEEIEKEWKKSSPGTLLLFRLLARLKKDN